MSRIERIRQNIIRRTVATDGWMEDEQNHSLSAAAMIAGGQLGRHLWRQAEGRRRQIVQRLLDLSLQSIAEPQGEG